MVDFNNNIHLSANHDPVIMDRQTDKHLSFPVILVVNLAYTLSKYTDIQRCFFSSSMLKLS